MGTVPELFGKVQTALDERTGLDKVKELIKRPLNELALSGAADLSQIKPACLHPLGFFTLYLGEGVCIHRWPLSYPEVEEFADNTVSDIHRHSWALSSIVMDGSIVNTEVEVNEIPFFTANGLRQIPRDLKKPDMLVYRIFDAQSIGPGTDLVVNTNRGATVQRNPDDTVGTSTTIETGQVYEVPLGRYHTSSWGADSLTLMTAVNYPGEHNYTLGALVRNFGDEEVDSHYVERQIFTAQQTANMAANIAVRLELDG